MTLLQYVVLNPIQSGMCAGPYARPGSSYRATVGTAPAPRFFYAPGVLQWFFDTNHARELQLYRSSIYSRLEQHHAATLAADAAR